MKSLFVIASLILTTSIPINSQVPNAGFESWHDIGLFSEPDQWSSNQDTQFLRISPSNDRFEGELALKIHASQNSAWTNCTAFLETGFSVENELQKPVLFAFYVKSTKGEFNSTGRVYLEVKVSAFRYGVKLNTNIWETFAEIEDWTQIRFPIDLEGVDSLGVQILGGGKNGADDGCYDLSDSFIDDIQIAEILSSSLDLEEDNIVLYPNPSSGLVQVNSEWLGIYERVEVYRDSGQLLGSVEIDDGRVDLSNYTGTLILNFIPRRGSNGASKAIKLVCF